MGLSPFLFATIHYQIITRSSGAMYMASPSLISNALKKVSILRNAALTRQRPNECGSIFVNRRIGISNIAGPQCSIRQIETLIGSKSIDRSRLHTIESIMQCSISNA